MFRLPAQKHPLNSCHERVARACLRSPEPGAALVVALCVMLMLLILGVSATRGAVNAERAARGDRDRAIAFQAAEAALSDAEADIAGDGASSGQRAIFFAHGTGFSTNCGAGTAAAGLCTGAGLAATPAWQRVALQSSGEVRTVPFGAFTGRSMPVGHGTLPVRLPRYLIESIPYAQPGLDAGAMHPHFYRITAIGFGASESTQVVLQSYYLHPATEAGAP